MSEVVERVMNNELHKKKKKEMTQISMKE